MQSHLGEIAALATACCWTVTALAFEASGRRVGSLVVNLIRLCLGFAFLSLYTLIFRGRLLPLDATPHAWLWLSLSGVVGFFLGDLFLFRAFVIIGSRISMLIMASVPPLTALCGWLLMREVLTLTHWFGMTLTLAGIAWVILERQPRGEGTTLSRPLSGILFAWGGALGQAGGLVLSKYGMKDYDAFAATQIRGIAGIICFVLLFTVLRRWSRFRPIWRDGRSLGIISLGAFFGPFLGVSLSLLAVQHTATGIAATIMALVPVLIIAPAVILFRERLTVREVVGALLAVGGVAILFR